jgi:hypothetical protein
MHTQQNYQNMHYTIHDPAMCVHAGCLAWAPQTGQQKHSMHLFHMNTLDVLQMVHASLVLNAMAWVYYYYYYEMILWYLVIVVEHTEVADGKNELMQ